MVSVLVGVYFVSVIVNPTAPASVFVYRAEPLAVHSIEHPIEQSSSARAPRQQACRIVVTQPPPPRPVFHLCACVHLCMRMCGRTHGWRHN